MIAAASEVLYEAWAGLWVHRVRSLLSGLGILFGVAAVLGILSIGEGARREQDALIEQLGILNFQIHHRPPPDAEAEEVRRKSRGLSLRDLDALAGVLPEARWVGGARELELGDVVPRPADPSRVRLLGADPAWLAGSNLVLEGGRPLTALDEQQAAPVALLGRQAARELFGAQAVIGQRLRVQDTWLTVVGVFDDGGGSATADRGPRALEADALDLDSRSGSVFVPLATALRRLAPQASSDPELTEIQITLGEVEAVSGNVAVARRALARLHHEQVDYEIVVPLRLLEQSRAQQRLFNLVMGLIAGISLLVGGIGIMNIMLASVLERTREIGVRLAVGARPRDVARLFLVEASLISLMGGAAGVVAGLVLARVVAAGTGWATAVSPGALVLALVVSVAEGLVFGWLPARRAAALPPMIALRQG